MLKISEHLYRIEDTCHVYALIDGDEAVLIDFGDGEALQQLASLGVRRITDVLMTHHHRDQGQGLARAVEAGARIWVPEVEQDLFAQVDLHWQSRELYNNYNNRQDQFSLLEPVPVAGLLRDYAELTFGRFRLMVIPTPGHTTGSITLLGEIDDRRVAFTGDLIAAPGKVWSLAATQWSYNGGEGLAFTVASLRDLQRRDPELLLPSHGEPITDPGPASELLVERLWELIVQRRSLNQRLLQLLEQPFARISPHLLWNRTSMANSYVLLSESKKALLIDFGYDFIAGVPPGSDRASRRPWLYTLPFLKSRFGVEKVDVVLPTHFHDDHVAGCNLLRRVEGAQVWAAENFARILQDPADFDLPCLWFDPIPVERVLPLETPIRWEEYEFTLHALPGHTRYAVDIAFQVDDLRVLATGDQYQDRDGLKVNYVYRNHFRRDDYLTTSQHIAALRPDLILSGHFEPFRPEPHYFDDIIQLGKALAEIHKELLPEDGAAPGEDFELRIRPYQVQAQAGQPFQIQVKACNPLDQKCILHIQIALPQGWQLDCREGGQDGHQNVHAAGEPAQLVSAGGQAAVTLCPPAQPGQPDFAVKLSSLHGQMELDPGQDGALAFEIIPPAGLKARRVRLAADLTMFDPDSGACRRYGQLAEAVVDVA